MMLPSSQNMPGGHCGATELHKKGLSDSHLELNCGHHSLCIFRYGHFISVRLTAVALLAEVLQGT